MAKLPPEELRVGQEMLASITSTSGTLSSSASAAQSSIVSEQTLSVDFKSAHADIAGAKSAYHVLLHGDLARNIMHFSKALHQFQKPVGAAGEEGIGLALLDQLPEQSLYIFDGAAVVGIKHG